MWSLQFFLLSYYNWWSCLHVWKVDMGNKNRQQSLTRGEKVQSKRERETWYFFFSFEKRKRNLKFLSSVLRGEREIWKKKVLHFWEEKKKGISFWEEKEIFLNLQVWEEKEKSEILFPSFEKRKRIMEKGSPLRRREREIDRNMGRKSLKATTKLF